jgi:hypothetical protein
LTDGVVVWIDHDDLEEFVGGVLANPVGVEKSERAKLLANSLLGDRLKPTLPLSVQRTLICWLSIDTSL